MPRKLPLITTANITMQFGAEPLFENISAQFGHGHRYGLIGANGCGKSTFMKILSGELVATSGNLSITPGNKVGTLSQDQFAFEKYSVVDTVIMGDAALWKIKEERDRIYNLPEMSEEDGMRVGQLESDFAEMDGYSAESRAGEILQLRIYPGNYEYFMEASSLIREQLLAENQKKSDEIDELQAFVNRFGANASKAKQASSRAKKMDKITLDEVKASSRMTPSLSFKQNKILHRQALILEDVGHGFDGETLFENGNLILEAGAKLAIIGENGVGKTTFLRCLVDELAANNGVVKWSENASLGYCPQDSSKDFDNDLTLFDWMSQWRTPQHNDLMVRGMLGRLLFTADDSNKKARNCSGGEKNRLLFGKLMMQEINVLVMDEPTNHMDMEAIEALNIALKAWDGTLIFVSHDREFVSSLANSIIEIKDQKVMHFSGTYDEYLDDRNKRIN